MMAGANAVRRIGPGVYRVEYNERSEIVYVARSPRERWAFWNGRVFRDLSAGETTGSQTARSRSHGSLSLSSPMPATVIKILVSAGSTVKKGDTVVVLEAMKMELPVRALADATVKAVYCHEGDLVQPDETLVELE
jgi:3-methylcrotonyl-CoA carboxylase alpha subunit